jgi:proline iminopeptidase
VGAGAGPPIVAAVTDLYPEIEPYDHGMLDVGDGHRLYWETSGNPGGRPAVVLHGGPGSGCTPLDRRFFDPAAYRIVVFDQRNCGRSTPHASDPDVDLSTNTTQHLLADLERLREHLAIDRWLLLGGSWGSVLGLAYAERHPERVSGMVIDGVTLGRPSEVDWLYHGLGRFFPAEWARFRAGLPAAERGSGTGQALAAAYHRLLQSPDAGVREQAARDWCGWEMSLMSTDPAHVPPERWSRPEWQLAYARIVTHYFVHDCFLDDGVLLREAGALAGIPGVLINGRLDFEGPLANAWELNQAWPDSRLVVVASAGHATSDPGMTEAILAALDGFARS